MTLLIEARNALDVRPSHPGRKKICNGPTTAHRGCAERICLFWLLPHTISTTANVPVHGTSVRGNAAIPWVMSAMKCWMVIHTWRWPCPAGLTPQKQPRGCRLLERAATETRQQQPSVTTNTSPMNILSQGLVKIGLIFSLPCSCGPSCSGLGPSCYILVKQQSAFEMPDYLLWTSNNQYIRLQPVQHTILDATT